MASTHNAPESSHARRRILETVKRTIAEYEMVVSGTAVLVGVSGGPDSVALLHILQHLTCEYGLRLAVAHLNHGLRKEADDEAEFVATLSAGLGLACFIKKEDVSHYRHRHRLSLEEAARIRRYAFYDDIAARHHFDKIALGHQADDNAELVLMFMIRGSGPVGFAGIPPVRAGRIIRPLIRLPRRDILDYLKTVGLAYVTDHSNRDMRFMRNRIRSHLVPLLRRSYNPKISAALNRLADIQREEQDWIEGIVDTLYRDVRLTDDANRLHLSITQLMRQPKAAQRRIIRKAIGRHKRRFAADFLCSREGGCRFAFRRPAGRHAGPTGRHYAGANGKRLEGFNKKWTGQAENRCGRGDLPAHLLLWCEKAG
jgi:tRNA(Ile)-lysidine synthase